MFNWAETNYPDYFIPSRTTTQIQGDSYFCDYTQSKNKLITQGDEVYIEGVGLDGQIRVGKISDFITPITQISFTGDLDVSGNTVDFECGHTEGLTGLPEANLIYGVSGSPADTDWLKITETGERLQRPEYEALGVDSDIYKCAYSVREQLNDTFKALGLVNVSIPKTGGIPESTVTQYADDGREVYFTKETGGLGNFQLQFHDVMLSVVNLLGVLPENAKAVLLRGEDNMADSAARGEMTSVAWNTDGNEFYRVININDAYNQKGEDWENVGADGSIYSGMINTAYTPYAGSIGYSDSFPRSSSTAEESFMQGIEAKWPTQ